MAGHDRLLTELRALGRADGIALVRRLSGGYVADVWDVGYQDGTRVVGKTVTCAPAGLFPAEADSLAALRSRVPRQHVRGCARTAQRRRPARSSRPPERRA